MADKAEKKVKIKLPKTYGGKPLPDKFVSVNERTFLIKRGEEVEVPECVAEAIQTAEDQKEAAYNFVADNSY